MDEKRKMDNLSMRIWLETIENVVGPSGLKSILNFAHLERYIENFPPRNDLLGISAEDSRALIHALADLFGQKGARALQLRAGREFVRVSIGETGPAAKALQMATRLLPEPSRMRLALEKYAEESEKRLASKYKPRTELKEEGDYFLFTDKDALESEEMVSQMPVCNVTAGLFQALMEWITGHPHEVEEIECRAMGYPADVFRILKARREE